MSFAGTWYPAARNECERMMADFKEQAERRPVSLPPETQLHGAVLPHAGWLFSGHVAYKALMVLAGRIDPGIIFLFGMHLPPGSPHILFLGEGFETPLGRVEAHREAAQKFSSGFEFLRENEDRHRPENTIELQLPFIRHFFPDVPLVAAGVAPGDSAARLGERACEVARDLGLEPCFLGSTDLTHYGPNYGFTPRGTGPESVRWVEEENDRRIIELMTSLAPGAVITEGLASRSCCCPGAVAAAMAGSGRTGSREGLLVQYSTSLRTVPDSSFVGYAGVVF
jgi:hypothetical protein